MSTEALSDPKKRKESPQDKIDKELSEKLGKLNQFDLESVRRFSQEVVDSGGSDVIVWNAPQNAQEGDANISE